MLVSRRRARQLALSAAVNKSALRQWVNQMQLPSIIKRFTEQSRTARSLAALGALGLVVSTAVLAHAQYRAIPNYVGIGAGLQFRNDINNHLSGVTPIAPRIVSLPFVQLPVEQDGQEYWCPDCQQSSPCAGGGLGALAIGTQGGWSCTSGAPLANGFPLGVDVSAGTHRIKSLAPNSALGDALSQGQSHLNDLATASANYSMGSNRLQNLGSGAGNGDALSYGQSGALLNGLSLNSNPLGGLAAATVAGQALTFAQNGAQLKINNAAIGVASSSLAGASGTPLGISAPANIVAGRALVMVFTVAGSTPGVALPSGFTTIRTDSANGNGSLWTQVIACKTATGSEPGSYSVSWTNGDNHGTGAVIQLSNTDCSHLDVTSGTNAGGTATLTIPNLTTTQNNEYILAAGSWNCGDVPAISIGQVFVNNSGVGRLIVSAYPQVLAGASLSPVVGPLNTNDCGLSGTAATGAQVAFIPNSTVQAAPLITNQVGAQLQSLTGSMNHVLTVTAPPYNALGDGNTDDLNSIQQAVYDACGANPPALPSTNAQKAVYLPAPPVCYMHSKPIRLPCPGLEFKGDLSTKLCQNYVGEAVIQSPWGVNNLSYGTALVPTGAPAGNSLVAPGNVAVAEAIDLARYMNGTGTNKLASKVTSSGFNIAFFMKATASGGQILTSNPAYPGTGLGAFAIIYNGSNQVSATINTGAGLVSLATCPAQTLGNVYEIELDWDKTTYRLWQGTPGATAALCSSQASSNAMVQGPFEEIMLPPGGAHQYWPDGSSNSGVSFTGLLDSIRFELTSLHNSAYTVLNAKFAADSSTYLLENFDASLDGTQIGYSGLGGGGNVYSVVLGNMQGTVNPGGNYIHDMELCSVANGKGAPDGIFAIWGNNSRYINLSCSNAYYAQADLFNNDYLSRVEGWQGFGGHVGLAIGAAFNDGILFDNQVDGVDVACEVNEGGGGGDYENFHPHCIDRGGLRYGWIQNASQAHYTYPFVDQESGAEPQWVATFLLNSPAGPNVFDTGNIDTRNGAPYILQDNGGWGSILLGMIFNTFAQDQPAGQVIKYTNGNPTTPTQFINTLNPGGVPLSNQAGNPNVLMLGVGQNSLLQSLELQQVPAFDSGLNHVVVNQIADPAAATISVVGTTGSTAYGPYYIVCHDANGGVTNVSPSSNTVANGNATLSSANRIHIAWTAIPGCTTWDVLKGNTSTSIALTVAGTSYDDVGASTAAYSAPSRNTTADVSGLMQISTGTTFAKIPASVVNGGRFYCSDCDPPANPPVTCTHSGAKTGSWVDGLNNQWLCVP